MKYKNFVYTSAIVMATLLTFSLGKATAQTTANGPYYATPSWDQQLPVATRFIVLSNWKDTFFPSGGAAVLDRETGLVWERAPSTTAQIWSTARGECANRTTGGRKGWRLPSFAELASLADPSVSNPALPAGHPFQTAQSSIYWSATIDADPLAPLTRVWVVFFASGSTFPANPAAIGVLTWCVRGGMNADAY
jgi:hypothetical protein